jgi:hypothetical protein
MPAQDRARRHDQPQPPPVRVQPHQSGQHRTISPPQDRSVNLATQHRDLIRNTRISTSFAASDRARSTNQPNTRTNTKYNSLPITSDDHAAPLNPPTTHQKGQLNTHDRDLGTHRVVWFMVAR